MCYVFLNVVVLHRMLVLPCHSCPGNMRKNYMPPFVDGELVVQTYVDSWTTMSFGRLMMVAVSTIVCIVVSFLLGCPSRKSYVSQFLAHPCCKSCGDDVFMLVCHTLCNGCQPLVVSYATPNLDRCNHLRGCDAKVWVEVNDNN